MTSCCGAVETRLAAEILRQGKKFYFVNTKVDKDLAATRSQRPSGFSEAAVLQEIWGHCAERLAGSWPERPTHLPSVQPVANPL